MFAKFVFLSLMAVSFMSTGCAALPASFPVTARSQTTVEAGTVVEQLVGSIGFGEFASFDIAQTQDFKNNDGRKKYIVGARVTKLSLTIIAPEDQNFDFLQSLEFFVNAPGLEKRRIAHKTIERGVMSFEMDIDDVELEPYVKADEMSITTTVDGRRPNRDTTLEAVLKLKISTSVLGAFGK